MIKENIQKAINEQVWWELFLRKLQKAR